MKIAAIVVTYNDDYKFNEWYDNYSQHKDAIYRYIIVDNNSTEEYFLKVKEKFSNETVLRGSENGGTTLAYNDGIKYALKDENIDAIMLIGNDMKISSESILELVNLLNSDKYLGMVEPIILSKDSDIIEDFGCGISSNLHMVPYGLGMRLADVVEQVRYVDAVTGGMNLSTREFYEKVGLQDEKLFMYSDEVDMGLRAKKLGFKMAVTSKAQAWHQHINPPGKRIRPAYTGYLIARNKIYLAYKHFHFYKAVQIFMYHFVRGIGGVLKTLFDKERRKFHIYFTYGSICGLFRCMKKYDFIIENK